ncbi:hypothetical protein J3458_012833 [Metarhizium acridum]|uniref:uncharacterized protein n=1 Tax=Metarhizium acridum TaxID=92637 RepID=UPI001C6B374A|nr:hypothetical protein J3458_012833 [Metarhizium acridum]
MASVLPGQEIRRVIEETCGWIEGNAGAHRIQGFELRLDNVLCADRLTDYPLKCQPSQRCARDAVNSIIGCCWNPTGGMCSLHTTCLDKRAATGGVETNSAMLCVASAAPYCKTDIFSGGPDIDGYSLFICDSDTKADTIYRYTTARSRADNAMTLDSITTFIPSSTSHRQSKTTISGVYTGSGIPITRSSLYISSERGLWSTSVITATKNPSTSMTSSGALTKSPAAMVGMVIGSAAALTIFGALSYVAYRYVKKRKPRRLRLRPVEQKRRPGDERHEVGVQVSR